MKQKRSVLPASFQPALRKLQLELLERGKGHGAVDELLASLSEIVPRDIARAATEIRREADFAKLIYVPRSFRRPFPAKKNEQQIMMQAPGMAYLYLFHYDGRVREAALRIIVVPPQSAFLFAAIVYRLNDWVEPVRRAAAACGRRVFPHVDPGIVAEAGMHFLTGRETWRRWNTEATVLDEALNRADVVDCIAERVLTRSTGHLSRILRYALRTHLMDRHLFGFFKYSAQPTVRAVALEALISGRATWRAGYEWQWVDKSFGVRRRVPIYEERPLRHSFPVGELITAGALDRSPVVRKVAADGLIANRGALDRPEALATKFASDKSRAVRERGEFALRAIAQEHSRP